MDVNSVYGVLQEVFPQVDTRILKAVAIEHSKDADSAVEVVLVEVIPQLAKETMASGSSNDLAVEDAHQPSHTEDMLQPGLNETAGTINDSSYPNANGVVDHLCGYNENCNVKVDLDVTTSHVTSNTTLHESIVNDDCNQVHVNTKNEEITSLLESNSVKVSHVSSTTSTDSCTNRSTSGNLLADWEDFGGVSASDCSMINHGESRQRKLCSDGSQLEVDNSVGQLAPSPVHEGTLDAPEGSLQLEDVHMLNSDYEKRSSGTSDASSKKSISASEMVDFKDEPALNTVITRSGQICSIDLLEDIIEDARNNKKKLFSAMESIIILMREVELQEKAAELAKEESVRAGLDVLTRVEDLKQMLRHAKEANEMHAGEVYGEKAILATEVRELQSRLLSLSDERDKSLAILDEMRQTLEERLDASEKERQEAEQEKMEKEESARNALAEQELIMDKVVQESKKLEEEAEENSKLREFLVDRGCIVDMLQGEISVICQDVKLLKEKFDDRVPLSKSLSSSQTTCILASSSSSLKSMAPDLVLDQVESSEMPNKTIPVHSDDEQLPSGVEGETNNHNALLVEDGWELF